MMKMNILAFDCEGLWTLEVYKKSSSWNFLKLSATFQDLHRTLSVDEGHDMWQKVRGLGAINMGLGLFGYFRLQY